jgi:hypothetical protein
MYEESPLPQHEWSSDDFASRLGFAEDLGVAQIPHWESKHDESYGVTTSTVSLGERITTEEGSERHSDLEPSTGAEQDIAFSEGSEPPTTPELPEDSEDDRQSHSELAMTRSAPPASPRIQLNDQDLPPVVIDVSKASTNGRCRK